MSDDTSVWVNNVAVTHIIMATNIDSQMKRAFCYNEWVEPGELSALLWEYIMGCDGQISDAP